MSIETSSQSRANWGQIVADRLPLYGHRNWIVVADSAYPAQSHPAIETICAGADQLVVLERVLAALRGSPHVKPIIHADRELTFVTEKDAPGIGAYRDKLNALVGTEVRYTPHEEIISMLDHAAGLFRVLIVKTNMTIPYTSVFLELDCAYWNADAEKRLRSAIKL
jgi:RbsD/FucU transport protein family protein